jgi:hypothetical protein
MIMAPAPHPKSIRRFKIGFEILEFLNYHTGW